MKSSLDLKIELHPDDDLATIPVATHPALPRLPCGWINREYVIHGRLIRLAVPNRPEVLLDASSVRAASDNDDYMPYWAWLWPASLLMADAIIGTESQTGSCWPRQAEVLEIGCGVGLVGLAALSLGYRVTLTDYDEHAVMVARHNAVQNGHVNFDAFSLDWRTPPALQYPVIIGCDLLYEPRNVTAILQMLDVTLAPGGSCWLSDVGRPSASTFLDAARRRGYTVTIRNHFEFSGNPETTEFRLFILTR